MSRSVLALALCPVLADAAKFAVIAVGSKGFYNYRHQADACHAYQIMKKSGIPEENIILMMQDDVASSSENPFPGKLYNRPGSNPPDVYDGCKPTYTGSVVTAKLFLSVITGDKSGVPTNGKVLTSGPDDTVFLNFVDHGGVGIVAFPNGEPLHVADLTSAIQSMQSKNLFKEMVFYMEACESGSMFPQLATDSKVLAVTAANAKESSWGTYCGSAAVVNGKNVGSCLGDLFSVSWMEDSDKGDLASETLKGQIARVTQLTNKSHVMVFGDTSFESEPIGNFETGLHASKESVGSIARNDFDVRDIPLKQAYWEWEHAGTPAEKEAAAKKMERITLSRMMDEAVFHGLVKDACSDVDMIGCEDYFLTSRSSLDDLQCHQRLSHTVHAKCPARAEHNPGGWNGFNMQYSQVLVNLCQGKQILGKSNDILVELMTRQCGSEIVV